MVLLDENRANPPGLVACAGYLPVTGRAPYGYRWGGAGDRCDLEPDPLTAPVVRRIFDEYASGRGLQVIAERLTADGVLRPSAYDRQRSPNHIGSAWSKVAVRGIITNGRYAAQHTDELSARCGLCTYRCATRNQLPLVPVEVYRQTQDILARRGDPAREGRSGEAPAGRYLLRGLLRCELCLRLMQGTWNNNAAYYRCRFPREYARANNIDHPPNIYLREDRLVVPLQDWICRSLPVLLCDWARRQPPAVRLRLRQRVEALRTLVACAKQDRAQHVDLFHALGMQLVYEPGRHRLRVRSEVLPGAVVLDTLRLEAVFGSAPAGRLTPAR